jgi:dihydrofolate reductase
VSKLIYSAIVSLDGYVADEDGRFDWAEPDEEVHAFVNELERGIGTYLYGRRMYEVMVAWENVDMLSEGRPVSRDYAAIWQRPKRSCTRRRWKRSRARGRGSSETSIPTPSGS